MFKVESSREAKEDGRRGRKITHVESGEMVAEINNGIGSLRDWKRLVINDKIIADVDSDKDAIESLDKFFDKIQKIILEYEEKIKTLENNKKLLNEEYVISVLDTEIQSLKKRIKTLEKFNLTSIIKKDNELGNINI